jgi:hypothetical protein
MLPPLPPPVSAGWAFRRLSGDAVTVGPAEQPASSRRTIRHDASPTMIDLPFSCHALI